MLTRMYSYFSSSALRLGEAETSIDSVSGAGSGLPEERIVGGRLGILAAGFGAGGREEYRLCERRGERVARRENRGRRARNLRRGLGVGRSDGLVARRADELDHPPRDPYAAADADGGR